MARKGHGGHGGHRGGGHRREPAVRNFKSKKAYDKWVAYGHIHGEMGKGHHKKGKPYPKVKVRGHVHPVEHSG